MFRHSLRGALTHVSQGGRKSSSKLMRRGEGWQNFKKIIDLLGGQINFSLGKNYFLPPSHKTKFVFISRGPSLADTAPDNRKGPSHPCPSPVSPPVCTPFCPKRPLSADTPQPLIGANLVSKPNKWLVSCYHGPLGRQRRCHYCCTPPRNNISLPGPQ